MSKKCKKCGNEDNYNFAINNGLCNDCIGEELDELEEKNKKLEKENRRLENLIKDQVKHTIDSIMKKNQKIKDLEEKNKKLEIFFDFEKKTHLKDIEKIKELEKEIKDRKVITTQILKNKDKLEKENKRLIDLLAKLLKVKDLILPKGSFILEEHRDKVLVLTKMFFEIEKELDNQ